MKWIALHVDPYFDAVGRYYEVFFSDDGRRGARVASKPVEPPEISLPNRVRHVIRNSS